MHLMFGTVCARVERASLINRYRTATRLDLCIACHLLQQRLYSLINCCLMDSGCSSTSEKLTIF